MKTLAAASIVGLFCLFFVTGCFPEEDSCNIKTAGIYVEYEVTEDNGSVFAKATFWTGNSPGGTNLILGQGDCIDTISVNGTQLSMTGSNPEYYHATVSASDSYDFVFERDDEDPYSSTVSTPASVTITAPDSGEEIARTAAFDIEWEDNGAGGDINLNIDGTCIDTLAYWDEEISDQGSFTVAADSLTESNDEGETCDIDIDLTREQNGTLSSGLKGTIVGQSTDGVSVRSTP